jgi:hypothetical protein
VQLVETAVGSNVLSVPEISTIQQKYVVIDVT